MVNHFKFSNGPPHLIWAKLFAVVLSNVFHFFSVTFKIGSSWWCVCVCFCHSAVFTHIYTHLVYFNSGMSVLIFRVLATRLPVYTTKKGHNRMLNPLFRKSIVTFCFCMHKHKHTYATVWITIRVSIPSIQTLPYFESTPSKLFSL